MEGCEAVMNLGFGSALVSKTIAEFVTRTSMIGNVHKRLSKVEEYVGCLEEEMRKIHAFKRELPLCMFLLSDAIVYLKEVSRKWCKRGSGEMMEKPVLQEIDLMKESEDERCLEVAEDIGDKKSWTSSFQLWNSDLNAATESTKQLIHKVEETSKSEIALGFETLESMEDNGFKKLEKKNEIPVPELSLVPPVASTLMGKLGSSDLKSSVVGGVAPSGSQKVQLDSRNGMLMPHHHQQQQSCRKQRRCWSPELHKAFVSALQELGGPQVATPKQIRDLMRVEGLTNDEVKSHLQKYRLHIRRVPNKQMVSSTSQSTAVLGISWNNQDHSLEVSKHNNDSESGSPPGPLELYGHHENDGSYD